MTKEQESIIAEVNSRIQVRIRPSPIHGVGIFALRNIPKGTRLQIDSLPKVYKIPYGSFSKLLPEVRALILERWPQVVTSSPFAYPDTRLQAYMNHSETPNYDAIKDETIKDIKQGEEVLEDYRKIPGYEKAFPWLVEKK